MVKRILEQRVIPPGQFIELQTFNAPKERIWGYVTKWG